MKRPWKMFLFVLIFLNFGTRTWSDCVGNDIYTDYSHYWRYVCSNMSRKQYQRYMMNIDNDDKVRQLELININLGTIDQHLFRNSKDRLESISYLTIKACSVTAIEDHSFEYFLILEKLYILDNNIIYASGQFVKYVSNLILLDLSNNHIEQFHVDCNDQLPFTNLILNNNSLANLREKTFNNCTFLKEIKIRNCNIKEIQKHSFVGLDSLSNLDLTNNPITTIEPGAFSGLTRISKIDLRDIFKNIKDIKSGMFTGFERVRIMNFTKLNIQSLEGRSFQGLKSLEYLHLANNNISILKAWTFADLPRLKYLSLDNNPIIEVEPHGFVNIPDHRIIDFHKISRHMKHIQEGFFDGIHNVTELNLTNLNISTIEPEAFEDVNLLESLFLNYNNLEALGEHQFSHLRKLQYLTLANNPIEFINPTAFDNLSNLQHLNLSSTKLTCLENGTFDSLLSLNVLDLSFCKLTTVEVEILRKNKLYLNNNQIEYVSRSAFQNLSSLNRLHLQFNKISHLKTETFSALGQLRYLDLSYNKLSTLSEPVLHPLKSLRQIDLSGNQWMCEHLTSLRKYFQSHGIAYHSKTQNVSVKNVGGIECNDYQVTTEPGTSSVEAIQSNIKNSSNKNVSTKISTINEKHKTRTTLMNNTKNSNKIMKEFSNSSSDSSVNVLDTMTIMNKLEEIYIIIYLMFIFLIGYLCVKIVCLICKTYKKYCCKRRTLQEAQNTVTEMVLLNRC